MRFAKLTIQYIARNFFKLLLVAIVPAIILGITTSPTAPIDFFRGVKDSYNAPLEFWDTFAKLAFFDVSWWKMLLLFFVLTVFTAIASGVIERHMKTGKFSYRKSLTYLNENIISMVIIFMFAAVTFVVAQFVITGLVVMWKQVDMTFNAYVTVCAISIVIVYLFAMGLYSMCIIWGAEILETGAGIFKGLAQSIRHARGNIMRMFRGMIIPIMPLLVIVYLFATLITGAVWINVLLNIVLFIFVYMYYVTFIYAAYYEIDDLDREDIKQTSIWKRRDLK